MSKNRENQYEHRDSYRSDRYDYCTFSADGNPEGVLIAKQIHAQSYVNLKIVRPEGLITLPDGTKIIDPTVSNPSGTSYQGTNESYITYALGVEKGSNDLDVATGRMVAWRKFYAPLDALPAYQFCSDSLWTVGEHYLRDIQADPSKTLAEPEALGKTINADRGVIKEFIRHEIQRSLGKGEVWFMGLVEKTVFHSWVHNWGPSAVMQIGEPKKLENPNNFDDVALVPTVMEIDTFYESMARDIATSPDPSHNQLFASFLYMSEGLSDNELGEYTAKIRNWARQVMVERENQ